MASQDFYAYRLTCSPEMGLFRLETFSVAYQDLSALSDEESLRYGIFSIKTPQRCELAERIIDYAPVSGEPNSLDLVFSVNGETLFRAPIELALSNGDRVSPNHVVSVDRTHAKYCWYADSIARRESERSYRYEEANISACQSKSWNKDSDRL